MPAAGHQGDDARHRDRQQPRPAVLFPLRYAGAGISLRNKDRAVTTLLRIDASPRKEAHSRRMADELLAGLVAAYPALTVCGPDLGLGPPPAIDSRYVAAMLTTFTKEKSAPLAELALSETF